MAEVRIDPIVLAGKSVCNGKLTKIVTSAIITDGRASVVGAVVLIVKSTSSLNVNASLPGVNSTLIKYVKSSPNAQAKAVVSAHKYKTISAALKSEGILETYTYDRDVRQTMKDYLPKYYDDLTDVMRMVETQANEVTRIQAKLNELLDQFYVNSATNGLDRWENVTDIEKIAQRSVDSRRNFINAKLRGVGTVTKELINEIVDAFYHAKVEEAPSELTMKITLLGKRGIPKNLEDIDRAVNDVIPAHVGTDYLFTYLTWAEVTEAALVWSEANAYTLKGLEEAFLVDPGFPHKN